VNDGKVKDPTDVANAFNNLFITNTEKQIVQQIEKGDAISILKIHLYKPSQHKNKPNHRS
jgi:hypothetical protein